MLVGSTRPVVAAASSESSSGGHLCIWVSPASLAPTQLSPAPQPGTRADHESRMRLVGILVTLLQASTVLSQGNFTQLQDEVEQDFPDGDTDNTDDKETSWTNDI